MYKTREEVEDWLNEMEIKNYVINDDLTVDVNNNVNISHKNLEEIPVKFGIIIGDFNCHDNKLTSLEGCPQIVNSGFNCSKNNLTNLEGCPQIVNSSFNCSNNNLKSLKDCLEIINGSFNCNVNDLISLEYCPKIINGSFYCSSNGLKNLDYCPEEIKNNFDCSYNELTRLKGCPEIINGIFDCYNNNLTSFEYFPLKIKGNCLKINKNYLKEDELINFNCDVINIEYVYSDFNKNGNKEEFLNKVNYYKSKHENELLKELSVNSFNVKSNKKL